MSTTAASAGDLLVQNMSQVSQFDSAREVKESKESKELGESSRVSQEALSAQKLTVPQKEIFPKALTEKYLLTPDHKQQIPLFRAIAQNDLEAVKRMLMFCQKEQLASLFAWVRFKPWMERSDSETKAMYEYLSQAFHQNNIIFSENQRFLPLEHFALKQQAGLNGLMIAVLEDKEKTLDRILQESPKQIAEVDYRGKNALLHAIVEGNMNLMMKLITVKIDPAMRQKQFLVQDNVMGYNAVMVLIATNANPQFIEYLFKSVDEKTKQQMLKQFGSNGKTCLSLACERKDLKLVQMLAVGAEKETLLQRDEQQCIPLFKAISNGHINIVQILLMNYAKEQIILIEQDLRCPLWKYVYDVVLKQTSIGGKKITPQQRLELEEMSSYIDKLYKTLDIQKTFSMAKKPRSREAKPVQTASQAELQTSLRIPSPEQKAVVERENVRNLSPLMEGEQVVLAQEVVRQMPGQQLQIPLSQPVYTEQTLMAQLNALAAAVAPMPIFNQYKVEQASRSTGASASDTSSAAGASSSSFSDAISQSQDTRVLRSRKVAEEQRKIAEEQRSSGSIPSSRKRSRPQQDYSALDIGDTPEAFEQEEALKQKGRPTTKQAAASAPTIEDDMADPRAPKKARIA